MGNTGIDNTKKLILSSLLVEHDAVRDVNYLDYCLTFQWAIFHLDVPILILAISNSTISVFLNLDYLKHHLLDLSTFDVEKVIQT